MGKNEIFISHAVKDKLLAESLVNLLVISGAVPFQEIICSSLEGSGIPKGKNFIEFIKDKLQAPKLVIMLLSTNYYDSVFCLCELGASWALSHNIFPILVSPLDYSDVKDVLTGIQCGKINDDATLCELRDKVVEVLGIKSSTARWKIELEKFMKNLDVILKVLPPPSRVSFAEYNKLEKSYEAILSDFKESISENEKLKIEKNKISKLKDKEEVNKVIIESLDDWGKFNAFVKNVNEAAKRLPNIVLEAIYYDVSRNTLTLSLDDDPDQCKEARRAQENGYLTIDDGDGSVTIEEGDPSISALLKQIYALKEFLEKQATSEFYDSFSEKYKFYPDITNRRFWEKLFDL